MVWMSLSATPCALIALIKASVLVAFSCAARTESAFCVTTPKFTRRSEEHTSELQSQSNLVCRLLLEKKKKKIIQNNKNNIIHLTKLLLKKEVENIPAISFPSLFLYLHNNVLSTISIH